MERRRKLADGRQDAIRPSSLSAFSLISSSHLCRWLAPWLEGQPVLEEVGTVRGYKVKIRYRNPGDERHKRVAEILARSMSGLQKEE